MIIIMFSVGGTWRAPGGRSNPAQGGSRPRKQKVQRSVIKVIIITMIMIDYGQGQTFLFLLEMSLYSKPKSSQESCFMSMIRFQAYFKKGLRYLNGGVKTGLSHYVEDKNPKLFHVKVNIVAFTIVIIMVMVLQGRRKPIVRQCMEISWSVMNR